MATSPTYLFLDTEWADAHGAELVSLALISVDGAEVFYAERDPLLEAPTDFVRAAVYPLLERGAVAMSDHAMTAALRRFCARFAHAHVLADYPNDVQLFRYVLDGFDMARADPRGPAVATGGAGHGHGPRRDHYGIA